MAQRIKTPAASLKLPWDASARSQAMVATPVDRYVGFRIKARRQELGMTAGWLAEQMGVTRQQAEKYERGDTRISAGRLFEIATILGIDPGWFFKEMKDGRELPAESAVQSLMTTGENVDVVRRYSALRTRQRKAVRDLIAAFEEDDQDRQARGQAA